MLVVHSSFSPRTPLRGVFYQSITKVQMFSFPQSGHFSGAN